MEAKNKKRKAGYAIVDICNPRPRLKDFHPTEEEANTALIERLTTDLQYGQSDLTVVPAIQSGGYWQDDITACFTVNELRTWNNIVARGK